MPAKKKRSSSKAQESEPYLSLSILLPYRGNRKGLESFFESLSRVKKTYQKDYEIIIIAREGSDWQDALPEGIRHLLDKNIIRPLEHKLPISLDAFRQAVSLSIKEHILWFNTEELENSFNFENFFSIKKDRLKNNSFYLPCFREQESCSLRRILLCHRDIPNYSCSNPILANRDFDIELLAKSRRLRLKTEILDVPQTNPFGEVKKERKSDRIPLVLRPKFLFNWYFKLPLKEFTQRPEKKYSFVKINPIYRFLFAATAVILLFLLPIMSYSAGNSGDEERFHYKHGLNVYNYFATSGADTSALKYENSVLHLYGPMFDLITVAVIKTLDTDKIYETRHVINGLAGWGAIVIAGMLAVAIGGWRAGFMVLILMFFSPRFLGHAFNNPKDIPFALGYIFSIYFILRFIEEFPKPRFSTLLLIALGIGFAIGVRVGGLMLIVYLFMFPGLHWLFSSKFKKLLSSENLRRLGRMLIYLIIVGAAGYAIGIAAWPYALQDPLTNPVNALDVMTNYATSIRQLFEGNIIWSNTVPWYYVPKYILITVPVVVLAGLIPFFFLVPKMRSRYNYLYIFMVAFTFVFPIIYIIDKESNVYGGWRHSMFTYTTLIVAAVLGYELLFKLFRSVWPKYILIALLVIGAFFPIKHVVANHPHQYIYYNELIGGTRGAFGRYEMDYYFHSLKAGSEWLIENVIQEAPDTGTMYVATNYNINYYFRKYGDKVRPVYTRYYSRGNANWDYAVFANSYINPFQLEHAYWPPDGTLHEIKVDGVPVCAVVERIQKYDYRGYQKLRERNYFGNCLAGIQKYKK